MSFKCSNQNSLISLTLHQESLYLNTQHKTNQRSRNWHDNLYLRYKQASIIGANTTRSLIMQAHNNLHSLNALAIFISIFQLIDQFHCANATLKPSTGTTNKVTNNWAVLVSSSKYWFNYRHAANVLSIYRSIKRLGIDDSHIILMLADDMACDPRNPWPGTIFNNAHHHINVYGNDAEVDYRGEEVTKENFIRLLTGRHHEGTPRSKKLLTDEGSNILIYLTGHGGNGFLKFRDKGELTSTEIADAFDQMNQKRRYNEILFIVDTCQAESLSSELYSPNIIGIGSSKIGQDSLSHHGDSSIGVYVIDRYTYYVLNFLEKLNVDTAHNTSLKELFRVCPESVCMSTVKVRLDLYKRDPAEIPITEFFGNRLKNNLIDVEDEISWMNML